MAMTQSKQPRKEPPRRKRSETRQEAYNRIRQSAFQEIIGELNDFIRSKSDSVSVPHNEAFNHIWKKQGRFSREMRLHYLAHKRALEFRKEDEFSVILSKYYSFALYGAEAYERIEKLNIKRYSKEEIKEFNEKMKRYFAGEASHPGTLLSSDDLKSIKKAISEAEQVEKRLLTDAEEKAFEEKIKCHFLLDAKKVCSLTEQFLTGVVYAAPIEDILLLYSCLCDFVLPNLDGVYPLFNAKIEAAFAVLSHRVGRCIGDIKLKGKNIDQRKAAGAARTERARILKDEIADFLPLIASEKNKGRKIDLEDEAVKKLRLKYKELYPRGVPPDYHRTVKNMVKEWKENNEGV